MDSTPERKLDIFRTMLLSRRLDERAWVLHRQKKISFHISAIGHEAAQVGAAFALLHGADWVAPYPRDLALMLSLGLRPVDYFKMLLGKPADEDSGGRQMPGHWNLPSANVISISGIAASHLPHAVGIAQAMRLRRDQTAVLASCGEGATSMGEWYEAVNWAAVSRLPIVFLVQNNSYAISTHQKAQMLRSPSHKASGIGLPVKKVDGNDPFKVYEAVDRMLEDARSGKGPGLVEALVMRIPPHSSDDDDRIYRTREEVEEARREDPLFSLRSRLLREGLLTRDLVLEMDADIKTSVEEALQAAEEAEDPQPDAETGAVYAIPELPPAREVTDSRDADQHSLLEEIRFELDRELADDDRVVLLGMDIGVKGGVFQATRGLQEKYGPDRVIDTPLSAAALVGVGIGMSLYGLRPVCEIQFADFIMPAFNQVVSEAARMFYRSAGTWQVPLVIRAPYGGGIGGGLYHSQSVEAFFSHVPGLKVMVCSDPRSAGGLLRSAVLDPNPVLFLEPKKGYRQPVPALPSVKELCEPDVVCVSRPGEDVSLLCYGMMHTYALQAADRLEAEGISVEVVDLRVLHPLDMEPILKTVKKTGKVLIVYEDNLTGGYGAEIAAQIAEQGFPYLDAPVKRLAAPDVPGVPFNATLQDWFMIDVDKIMAAVRSLVKESKKGEVPPAPPDDSIAVQNVENEPDLFEPVQPEKGWVASLVRRVDLTRVEKHRQQSRKNGLHLTYSVYFTRAITQAVSVHPETMAYWTSEGISRAEQPALGFRIFQEAGEVAPTFMGLEKLSLVGLARVLQALANKARSNSIQQAAPKPGTIAVVNYGSDGPMWGLPELAGSQGVVLGIGAVQHHPAFSLEGEPETHPFVYISMRCDCRVLPELEAKSFLNTIADRLEHW